MTVINNININQQRTILIYTAACIQKITWKARSQVFQSVIK